MEVTTVVQLVKDKEGIRSSTTRDPFITAIVNGVISDLKGDHGLTIDLENHSHIMFITDYASWRYNNKESKEKLPRHLQFRLHNMIIHNKEVVQ
ncbi:MAG: hypothetical protein K0R92_525 [Lachnospiraceae bacterium]|jgi:hypothetical protein|nr:hypothetical protein [Lachnospiraceae bacterium]